MKILKLLLFTSCKIICMLWFLGVTSVLIPYEISKTNIVLGWISGIVFWIISIGFIVYAEIYCTSSYGEEI